MGWILTSIRVFENIYCNQQRTEKTGQNITKMLACFTTEFQHVSLKISWNNHPINMSHFHSTSSQVRKQGSTQFFDKVLLLAVRYSLCLQTNCCRLQSLEATQSNSKHSWPSLQVQAQISSAPTNKLCFQIFTSCYSIGQRYGNSDTGRRATWFTQDLFPYDTPASSLAWCSIGNYIWLQTVTIKTMEFLF